ncbi:MAG: hypothetical protein ACI9HG_002058, partial [Flavobacteriales bacterium]
PGVIEELSKANKFTPASRGSMKSITLRAKFVSQNYLRIVS